MATSKSKLDAKVKKVLGANWRAVWFRGHRAGKGSWIAQAIDTHLLGIGDPRHRHLGYNFREANTNLDKMIIAGRWLKTW